MTAEKSWFFPPNFDMIPEVSLKLGTVIKFTSNPIDSLLRPGDGSLTDKMLPGFITQNLEYGPQVCIGKNGKRIEVGGALVERRVFDADLSQPTRQFIIAANDVNRYLHGGYNKPQGVYIVSGIMVVKKELAVSASGPNLGTDEASVYPNRIYAYRIHQIRRNFDYLLRTRGADFHTDGDENEDTPLMDYEEATAEIVRKNAADMDHVKLGQVQFDNGTIFNTVIEEDEDSDQPDLSD
ncbi:unnamed protein product [Clonostachys rosea]|uniref:Uncharacterized protein n=1 Tax=Bionectria ochroleuca TaxID=29856 RepID=A0ABY6U4I4_BIOOC|nr:unnamed protein product [Clonostachys rosea]